MQITFIYYLYFYLKPKFLAEFYYITSIEVGLARFMCGVLLHYSMSDHIRHGLDMMKFSLNHPWKFKDPHTAFFAGFSKAAINIITELLNYSLLLTSDTVINCLWNFLGLNVVRRVGDYMYG